MSGPTPITVDYRLTLLYTVSLLQHKHRMYMDCIASLDPSGFDAVGYAPGVGNVGVSTIADHVFDGMKVFYNPSWSSFDGWILEKYISGAYVFQSAGATATVPTGGGTIALAGGWDTVGKDLLNNTIHAYWYEGNFRLIDKSQSYSSLNAAEKEVIDMYFGVGRAIVPEDPANFRKARSDAYIMRWLSAVWDSNQKLRRIRRLA